MRADGEWLGMLKECGVREDVGESEVVRRAVRLWHALRVRHRGERVWRGEPGAQIEVEFKEGI